MKRDMELVRKILLEVQRRNDPVPRPIQIEGYEDALVQRHAEMMHQAGILEGLVHKSTSSHAVKVFITDMSWEGHELVSALENENVWTTLKKSFGPAELASLPWKVLTNVAGALASKWAMQKLGLAP